MIFKLREADEEDIPVLDIVRRQAIEAGYDDAYEQSEFSPLVAAPDQDMETWLKSDHIVVYLVETRYTPACYGAYDRESGQILDIFTAPEYERKGYAGRILERFEETATDDGRGTIHVHAPYNAREFFEKKGFEQVDEVEKDGLEALELEKDLQE